MALVLYLYRFLKIPKHKTIIEQQFVAAISVLLIMFNDPFYPITILKPNGGRYHSLNPVLSLAFSS